MPALELDPVQGLDRDREDRDQDRDHLVVLLVLVLELELDLDLDLSDLVLLVVALELELDRELNGDLVLVVLVLVLELDLDLDLSDLVLLVVALELELEPPLDPVRPGVPVPALLGPAVESVRHRSGLSLPTPVTSPRSTCSIMGLARQPRLRLATPRWLFSSPSQSSTPGTWLNGC